MHFPATPQYFCPAIGRLAAHAQPLSRTLGQILGQLGGGQLHLPQGAQIVIPARLEIGPRVQGPHLAVADVQQPGAPDCLAHLGHRRHIQSIVGPAPRHKLADQGQAQRVQARQHDLDLRQIRAVIFAVAELQQAVLGHGPVACGRRAVEPHRPPLQIVHPQQTLVQRHLKRLPAGVITQGGQDIRQPIIGEVQRADHLRTALAQRHQALFGPRLHMGQAMITLRQRIAQPDRAQPAQTQPLPVAVRRKMHVQQLRQAHPHLLDNQHRGVVHPFTVNGKFVAHAPSLPQSSNSR